MTTDQFTLDPSTQALLHDLGVSTRRVLRRAALPGDLFSRGPAELSAANYFRFWEALDAESGDPNLPVTICRAISAETFSPPVFAALCSSNLEVAAHRIAGHKPLIGAMRVTVTTDRTGLTVVYHWPAGVTPPQVLATTELVFWVALARIATRHHVRAVRVTAPHLPPDPDAVADYLGVRMRKGPTQSITFAPADAARPFLTENEQMWQFFAPHLRQRLSELHQGATTTERVRAALHETLPAGNSAMTTVGSHLAISTRTLQRQLRLEGTTYQAVLADTRESLARYYLTHGTMTTAEIAYLLGYDDTNSFYRAFRAWTGTTPETVRNSEGPATPATPGRRPTERHRSARPPGTLA
jgi:AraC-like DNA-binding protein